MSESPVIVVGAGLAGLATAVHLTAAGVPVKVLEASDGPGGRVRSDVVDGFVLDRGFQVYLTAYPEGKAVLDYEALRFREFAPGAVVRVEGEFHTVADPLRSPGRLLSTLQAPIGTAADKARIAALALAARTGHIETDLTAEDIPTVEFLRRRGFSDRMIDRFFRPLFGGVLLDHDLATSSRMFRYVWRMLAIGESAVPADGMQAIPLQLAARLPEGVIEYESPVASVAADGVHMEDGSHRPAHAVVVAVEGPAASRLLGIPDPGSRRVSCVYFAAGEPPFEEPLLVLNGDGADSGPVNNLAVMTNVSAEYGPDGAALVAAACLEDGEGLEQRVRTQLTRWYGAAVADWRHLRTYEIAHAQPEQLPPFEPARSVIHDSGVFVAGDHRSTASINGALESGRLAAEAVIASS